MKLFPKYLKRPLLFVAGFACVIAISACVTTTTAPHATQDAPFVISFEFIQHFTLPQRQVDLFEKALNKYAVRSLTRVHENGHLIWPLRNMKTMAMMKSPAPPAEGPMGGHPTKTDSNESAADGGHYNSPSRPTKTDVVAFANANDLRNFLNCIQGNGCPGGN
jgi:hypothetical protein